MPLIIRRLNADEETVEVDEYPSTIIPKVLASGALKLYEPAEFEVPELGSEDAEIAEKGMHLVAILNHPYILTFEAD